MPTKNRLCFAASALVVATFLAGCPADNSSQTGDNAPPVVVRKPKTAAETGAFQTTDPWQLTTNNPDAVRGNHGIYLSSGTIGATFGKTGAGDDNSVVFRAGLYDDKENFRPVFAGYKLALPEIKSGDPYRQTLDMKRGVLVTEYGGRVVTAFVSSVRPDVVVINVKGATRDMMNPVGGDGKLGVSEAVSQAAGRPTRYVCADAAVGLEPNAADSFTLVYAVSVGTTPDAAKTGAYNAAQTALATGFDALLTAHVSAWEARWNTAGIEIVGDAEAQQLVNKLQFDLLQSVAVGGDDSVAPEALSGNFYKGHIFWDADVWMFPALLAQHVGEAKNLLDYRYKTIDAARTRARAEGFAGLDFAWESAAIGSETAPGGFATGRHITGGVGLAAWQYYLATGDTAWLRERGFPLLSGVADHFASRAKKNAATGKYEIKGVYGPDENKGKVDNNTYTNALAKYCLENAATAAKVVGKPADTRWADVAKNIALPFDTEKGAYLARDADDLRPTKQADGELVIYPARLSMDKATAEKTFALHVTRPIKSGPAMTASMHALIAARLGKATDAETYFRESYRPFVRGAFLLFSEKRSLDRCVFTTGAGGVLQSVIYGFGGVDFDRWDAVPKAPVALPASWKSLTLRGVSYKGKRYTVTVTQSGRTVTPD